jgi:hypothetical protein
MSAVWKRGRGRLGILHPLLGRWEARADSPMGPVRCTRIFTPILATTRIRLDARWEFAEGGGADSRVYEELAIIGAGDDGRVRFWSFTSDGKSSQGVVADVTDIHPSAVGFEAQMPAGLARMAYWPDENGGFRWAVESRNTKGWRRFVEHRYRPLT